MQQEGGYRLVRDQFGSQDWKAEPFDCIWLSQTGSLAFNVLLAMLKGSAADGELQALAGRSIQLAVAFTQAAELQGLVVRLPDPRDLNKNADLLDQFSSANQQWKAWNDAAEAAGLPLNPWIEKTLDRAAKRGAKIDVRPGDRNG